MVYASSGPHLDLPEDANRLANAGVQPDAKTETPIDGVAQIVLHDRRVVDPAKVRRRASVVKAQRLARVQETAAVGLALMGLFVGYVAWRLSEGTISISAATPYVETALEKIVGGKTKIGTLRLGWDKARRDFVVTATNITATTDARTSPLALGQVNLTLNARALLSGRAQITRADITDRTSVV